MADEVFISYAREDRAIAEGLANRIEAVGLEVWWDRDLHGGERFVDVIEQRLDSAGSVVVVWSAHSAPSMWVRAEAARAEARNVMVPVRIDATEPPLPFGQLHTIELSGWDGQAPSTGVDELIATLRARHNLAPRTPLARDRTAVVAGASEGASGRGFGLSGDEPSEAARPWTTPAQLPRDITHFTGREDALSEAEAALEAAAAANDTTPVIAVFGQPGVGKTAFAVRLARALADRYPDGQLYVNLRGAEPEQLDPAEVLVAFLEAVGVSESLVPPGAEAREGLYRGRLARRRVLVLLDNAANETQVRPLLPGGHDAAVLVTSRTPLLGIDVTQFMKLEVFEPHQSLELLGGTIGGARVQAEPAAAQAIVELCGHLPLAVRIIAAKLATKPDWHLERMATRLGDERGRLDELQAGDREVRASFQLSYQGLDGREQQAFRRLGLLPFTDFPAWVVAVLLDAPKHDAQAALDELVDAQLVESGADDDIGEPRYRLHDLLRLFARERLEAEEDGEARLAATTRVVDAYLALAHIAESGLGDALAARLDPAAPMPVEIGAAHEAALRQRPLAWLQIEKANLVAAAVLARDAGLWEPAVSLSRALNTFFIWHAHWDDSFKMKNVALDAAQRAADRHGEGLLLFDLGGAYLVRNQWPESIEHLQRARALLEDTGDVEKAVEALLHLGVSYRDFARYDQAVTCFEEALPRFEELGNDLLAASTRHNLGIARREQGDINEAIRNFELCLPIFDSHGDRIARARVLHGLGVALRYLGRHEEARPHYQESLALCREVGDLRWEGILLLGIGRLDLRQGKREQAAAGFEQALPLFRKLGDTQGEAHTYRSVGAVLRADGDHTGSAAYLERALEILADLGHERGVGQVTHALGVTANRAGALNDATSRLREAVATFGRIGDRVWQLRSLVVLGSTLTEQALHEAAAAVWEEVASLLESSLLPPESELRSWASRTAGGGTEV